MKYSLSIILCAIATSAAHADTPQVEGATVSRSGDSWSFDVTLTHPDTGWDHYADGWQVLAPDGTVLGTRALIHPHETEQPFTRSLSGIAIPAEIDHVLIRTHCTLDGWGAATYRVDLP